MATIHELERDPHPVLARLRASEPVSWMPALRCWLVTRYDLAARVMRDPETFTVNDPRFSTSRVVGPSMLSLDGTEHARHREPFAPAFRPAEVRSRFTRFIEQVTGDLIATIEPRGRAELRRDVAGPLAVAVVAEALGMSDVDALTVLSWYAAIVEAVSEVTAGRPAGEASAEAFTALRTSVERTVAGPPSLLAEAANPCTPRKLCRTLPC